MLLLGYTEMLSSRALH